MLLGGVSAGVAGASAGGSTGLASCAAVSAVVRLLSASGPAEARPAQERQRRLKAFVTRVLADAGAHGFTLDDVLAGLAAHRRKGA